MTSHFQALAPVVYRRPLSQIYIQFKDTDTKNLNSQTRKSRSCVKEKVAQNYNLIVSS